MSNDESTNVPAKRDRREAVREKAQQVQTKQSRLRLLRRAGVGVAALAVVGGIVIAITWALSVNGSRPQLQPKNSDDDGFEVTAVSGIAASVGTVIPDETPAPSESAAVAAATPTPSPTAAPAVDIRVYVDYLSAQAREFQLANVSQLSQWVGQDTATLTYYPVAMLTAKSNGTKYSLRAASAAACVATHSPEQFFSFNDALLRQQPEIDSDGMTDDELADLAAGASVENPEVVRECIEDEAYAAWVKAATDRALQGLPGTDGVSLTGTPMILVNGTQYVGDVGDPKEFQQFVFSVASDAYFRTPTPTPTPTTVETATPVPSTTP